MNVWQITLYAVGIAAALALVTVAAVWLFDRLPDSVKAKFYDSETIMGAKLQIGLGTLGEILVHTDLSAWLPNPAWKTAWVVLSTWLVASGMLDQWKRRRRDPDMET